MKRLNLSYKTPLLGLFCLVAANKVKAQQEDFLPKLKLQLDSTYVQSFKEKLAISFLLSNRYNSWELIEPNGKRLSLRANDQWNFGFGASWRWIALNFSWRIPGTNDDDRYGETNKIDLQAKINARQFTLDLNLTNYKGFYLANARNYDPDWFSHNTAYPLFPDMRATTFGADFLYVNNNRQYSYNSSFGMRTKQLRSAGSLLYGGYTAFNKVDLPTIAPAGADTSFAHAPKARRIDYFNIGPAVGYTYTFVFGKYRSFFLTMGGVVGAGYTQRRVFTVNEEFTNTNSIGGRLRLRLAVGHNGEIWFGGLVFSSDSYLFEGSARSIKLSNSMSNIRLSCGRRFDLRKKHGKPNETAF